MSDNIFADLIEIATGNVAAATFHFKALSDLASKAQGRAAVSPIPVQDPVNKVQRCVRWLTWLVSANLVVTTICLIKVCFG